MKKLLLFGGATMLMLSMVVLDTTGTLSNPSGAPFGNTGSPGDLNQTCAHSGCHSGAASDRDEMITSDIPSTGYIPGQTYSITVSISQSGFSKWGFQISPQSPSGALLGTLSLTDVTRTRFVGTGNKYITHTTAGNTGAAGTTSWSFNWTAPAATTGDVTFYAAVMAANGNGNNNGDSVFKDNLTVSEDLTSSIYSAESQHLPFAFPNPVNDNFVSLNVPSNVSLFQLYDLTGRMWLELPNTDHLNVYKLNISEIPAGVYMIKMKSDNKEYIQRIIRR